MANGTTADRPTMKNTTSNRSLSRIETDLPRNSPTRRRRIESGAKTAAGNCLRLRMKRRLKSSTVTWASGVTARFVPTRAKREMTEVIADLNEATGTENSGNASPTVNRAKRLASRSLPARALRILVREEGLSRVAEVNEKRDVHAEMMGGLLVNLTDRKVKVVRFEIERTGRSKDPT